MMIFFSVPINTGCLGSCTYCKTRHARGKLGSYQSDAIVKRVKDVFFIDLRGDF